jgi:hypothetical protein
MENEANSFLLVQRKPLNVWYGTLLGFFLSIVEALPLAQVSLSFSSNTELNSATSTSPR